MAKKRYSPEQIIQSLREVEIHTSEGKTIAQSVRHIGVTEQTYYRWRKEYGGFRPHSDLNYQPPAPSSVLSKVKRSLHLRLT